MKAGPLLVAGLVLALGARPAAADDRARKYYYEDITEPFFVPDPAKPGWLMNARPGSKTSSFPAKKPKDSFRVFVLGGSIAGLLQTGRPEHDLQPMLQDALPGLKVEVINCGMAGYETFREALVEQEVLEYQPDAIVFLTGHNEGIASPPMPVWIMRAQDRLSGFAAFRALVKTLHPELDNQARHTDATADARDAVFARNLAANLEHAKERGVRTVLVVPPRNYREPAEVSVTPYDAALLPGWVRFLRGDYRGARKRWRAALSHPGEGAPPTELKALGWGLVARAEEKLGLADQARASFEEVSRDDRAAICGARCQDIIRRQGREHGALLVEADAMFKRLTAPRMPGLDVFNDRMHWKARFNCLIASELIKTLRADAALGALPWDDARAAALSQGCARPGGGDPDEDDDLRRTLSYVLMALSWPNMHRLSTVSVFYLDGIHQKRPRWFSDVTALMHGSVNPQTQVYGLSMAADAVVLPRFYWHVGEVKLLERDFAGAAADLEKAVALEPSLAWARVSLGVAYGLRGDRAKALAALEDAVRWGNREAQERASVAASAAAAAKALDLPGADEVWRSDIEYWLKECQRALDAGDARAALAAVGRAERLAPDDEQARRLAQYRRLIGGIAPGSADELGPVDPERAARSAKEAVLARAQAATAKGDAAAAVAALDRARALGLDPEQLRRAAQYYRMLRLPRKLLEICGPVIAAYPKDADLRLMQAEALLVTGSPEPAAEALSEAERLATAPGQKRQAAQLRRWLKEGVPDSMRAGEDGARAADGGR